MRRQVNVLVVIAVLILVGGLVMAAVPRVQNAAARMQCYNNLKQLGLGLENYHDPFGAYPSATVPDEGLTYMPGKNTFEGLPAERRLSWCTELVPFLDQIRVDLDRAKAWDSEENIRPMFVHEDKEPRRIRSPVGEWRVFRCPSNSATAGPGSPGLAHYVGVAGLGDDAASRSEGTRGIGVFGHYRRTRHEDIKDGTTTTMMVIETTANNGPWTAGGYPTVRGLNLVGGIYLGANGQFSSNHNQGDFFTLTPPFVTNVVFADGSVRSLMATIKPEVFEALATIADGEEVVDW